jgi:hypothetical protein
VISVAFVVLVGFVVLFYAIAPSLRSEMLKSSIVIDLFSREDPGRVVKGLRPLIT